MDYLKSYEYRLFFLVCFTMVGFVSSKSVMSIGVVAMFANILLDFVLFPEEIKNFFPNFIKQKKLVVFCLVFLTSFLALSYSNNFLLGSQFVINKIPFLVIPLSFSRVKKISNQQFQFIMGFFVVTMFISAIVVLYNYLQNFEFYNVSIKKGAAIWVPFNHIRYSVMLVFAFCLSIYLAFQTKSKWLKIVVCLIASFLFILIHLLSVRSGLLVLYICLFFALVYYIAITKKFKWMWLGLALLIFLPILSYQLVPSFRNKIIYMKYDWEQFQRKNIGSNSDSRRLVSYEAGFSLLKEHMPFGVGTGSLQEEMDVYFAEHYPKIRHQDRIAPHNQLLFTLLDCGIFGFLAMFIALFYPLLKLKRNKESLLYILFWISACVPLIYDISLETQLGIIYFVLFSSFLIKKLALERSTD